MSLQPFKYVPAINGLRALSILAVMGFHGSGPVLFWLTGRSGWSGVNVFFVISGYLITALLLDEKNRNGKISLQRFYVRRLVRIFPAYYFFLAIQFVLWILWDVPERISHGLIAVAYMTDIDLAAGWGHSIATGLVHPWSLAMEEKFYAIFPLLLKIARRHTAAICGLLLIAVEGEKLYQIVRHTHWSAPCGRFDTSAESLLIGCLAGFAWAFLSKRPELQTRVSKSQVTAVLFVAFIVCFRIMGNPSNWHSVNAEVFGWLVKFPLLNALVALLLLSVTFSREQNRVASALGAKPIAWLGKLSYSLYLWHMFGFLFAEKIVKDVNLHQPVIAELLKLAVSLLFATFSYFAIEAPFLRWKQRLSARDQRPPVAYEDQLAQRLIT